MTTKMTTMDAKIRAHKEENIGLVMALGGLSGSILSCFIKKNKVVSTLLAIGSAAVTVGGVYVSAHGGGIKDGLDWTEDNDA